jgi:hypothetical protein
VTTNLELARELLECIDLRREARNEAGNLGEWQTELNEVARVLHYLISHLDPKPAVRKSCGTDDDDLDFDPHYP